MALPTDEHIVTRTPGGGWTCKCGEHAVTFDTEHREEAELVSLFGDDE